MILDEEDGDQYGYFILRPVYGEALSGERVDYVTALGVYSGASTVEVAQITGIDTGSISTVTFGGAPQCLYVNDYSEGAPPEIVSVEATITYDGGGTSVPTGPDGGGSVFLVELMGNQSYFDVYDGSGTQSAYLHAAVMADGGQSVVVNENGVLSLQDTIGTIKIWRVTEGDTPPTEPTEFWTSFVGSREIV